MDVKKITMNNLIKKLFGIDKIESKIAEASLQQIEAERELELAKELARQSKLSPKELANEKKEPWVAVLDTHVNKENIRNGFFELDWNEYFVLELRAAGYKGDSDEEIVDRWFSDLCHNVGADAGVSMEKRGSGYINVNNLPNGRSEVS